MRHTAGSISTTIVGTLGLVGWPEFVIWLVGSISGGKDAVDSSSNPALDGALDSLSKVVEDHPHQVGGVVFGGRLVFVEGVGQAR